METFGWMGLFCSLPGVPAGAGSCLPVLLVASHPGCCRGPARGCGVKRWPFFLLEGPCLVPASPGAVPGSRCEKAGPDIPAASSAG